MYHYIDDEVKMDFNVPKDLKILMEECEEFDLKDDYGAYMEFATLLTDVASKEVFRQGRITKEQWDKINERYLL